MAEKGPIEGGEPPAYPGTTPTYSSTTPTYPGGSVDPAMPTTYNTPPPTYVQPTPSTVNTSFLLSPDGIFIAAEGVMSFLLFVCAAADGSFAAWGGGGWVIFVGVFTWLISIMLFLLHLLNITEKMPSYMPLGVIEMGYTGTASALIFISACIASSRWWMTPAVRACAMFCWFGLIVYGADTVRRVMLWRHDNQQGLPTTVANNSTTTSTPSITTEPHY